VSFGIGGAIALVVLALLSVRLGATPIETDAVLAALSRWWGLAPGTDAGPMDRIIIDLRLPRALVAIMVGAGLGIVGCLLQSVTRNDLADPFLFGLSSGAAAGAVFVITVTGDALGIWTLPLAAFSGGMIASVVVLGLFWRIGFSGPEKLVLAGLAVSFLFAALTNFLVFAGDQRAAHSVLFWTLGGLGNSRWDVLPVAAVGFLAIAVFALMNHRALDALLAGDLTAASLGVRVNRLRIGVFLVCAFATAIFVSITGVIGFVGLMVPHIARAFVGTLSFGVVTVSAIVGAALLLASDILARVLLAPQELPIGIVTSSIGAIFIVSMLLSRKSR
jgi:iron complex transport system permease protein